MNYATFALTFNFVWICGCTLGTLLWLRRPLERPPSLVWILTIAFLIRIVPALVLPRGAAYEMALFQQTADAWRSGQNIYTSNLAHPYFPFIIYWYVTADWLSEHVGLFFIFWLKSISIVADTLITGYVYLAVSRSYSRQEAGMAAWIYALNPVTVLVCSVQGQFDAIPVLLLMLLSYLFSLEATRFASKPGSALLLGAAVLSKTWPIIMWPMAILRMERWRPRILYTLLVFVVPIGGLLLYETIFAGSIIPIIQRAVRAGAISGWWGYSSLVNVWRQLTGTGDVIFVMIGQYGKLAAYLVALLVIIGTRNRSLLASLLATILVMFALVPNLGLQGLAWPIPIALILRRNNSVGWYIAGATIHMLIAYWGIHLTRVFDVFVTSQHADMIIQLSSLSAWLIIVIWSIQELVNRNLLPAIFGHDSAIR